MDDGSPRFAVLADEPTLDLINTRRFGDDGEIIDLLPDTDALELWLTHAGLGALRTTPSDLADVRQLRDAAAVIAEAFVNDRRPPPDAVAAVNGQLAGRPGHLRVQPADDGYVVNFIDADQPSSSTLVAERIARFLRDADPQRVHRCEAQDCVLYFYDRTRNRSRRWCSMSTCGNRAKVRAHYERQQRS